MGSGSGMSAGSSSGSLASSIQWSSLFEPSERGSRPSPRSQPETATRSSPSASGIVFDAS
jgi:hypothetical protein